LSSVLQKLLTDDERRQTIAENGRAALKKSRGATARTIQLLSPILAATPGHAALGPAEGAHADDVLSA
jgi:hypothetical protein